MHQVGLLGSLRQCRFLSYQRRTRQSQDGGYIATNGDVFKNSNVLISRQTQHHCILQWFTIAQWSNGMNLGRQTKPQKPRYKLLNSGPIREGQVSDTLVVRQVPLVARQVALSPVTTAFLSPKQLYRYKKTPIHWYWGSTITGISWSTQKTSILLHIWAVRYNFLSLLYLVISLYNCTLVRIITITR